jgi:hypothetical protein
VNALDFATVVAAWALFLAFRQTRTLRTVAFLTALTVVYVAAGPLASPWRPLIRVIVIPAVVGAVVLKFNWLIWSMSRAELDYDEFIHDLAERLHRLNQPVVSDRALWERYTDEYRAAAHQLEERPIPHPEWAALRDRFLDHIRFNLDVFEGRRPADLDSRDRATAHWSVVREEWRRVRRSRSRFWR